ncbi:MAG: hypothetical protein ACFB21_09835 [Opitutales bacterium]
MTQLLCSSILAATLLAANARALEISGTDAFNFLNDGMPPSIELGQTVNFSLTIDTGVRGVFNSGGYVYTGALTSFTFEIPDLSFSASGSGDIFSEHSAAGDSLILTGLPVSGAIDNQALLSTEFRFALPSNVDAGPGSLATLSASEYDGFEVFLATMNNGTTSGSVDRHSGYTSGFIATAIPEPNLAGFLGASLGMLIFARRRQI